MDPKPQLDKFGPLANPSAAKKLQRRVAKLLWRKGTEFPGSQPVSLSREGFSTLENDEYLVYEKSDGVRCLLFIDSVSQAQYLVERRNVFIRLEHPLFISIASGAAETSPGSAYYLASSLLDGELVSSRCADGTERYVFLAFDCLVIDDRPLIGDAHFLRMEAMRDFLARAANLPADSGYDEDYGLDYDRDYCGHYDSDYGRDPTRRTLGVQQKQSLPACQASYMLSKVIPSLGHNNDGLVFIKKHGLYVFGSDSSMLKWKEPANTSVDFLLDMRPAGGAKVRGEEDCGESPYTFAVRVFTGRGHKYYAELNVDPHAERILVEQMDVYDGRVIECIRDSQGSWRPKMDDINMPSPRWDKDHGNHISVVKDILRCIEDNVTKDVLLSVTDKLSPPAAK